MIPIDSLTDVRPVVDNLRKMRTSSFEHAQGTTRAFTMNFVVFASAKSTRDWVRKRAMAVAEKHPSRLVFIDACDDRRGAAMAPVPSERVTDTVHNEFVDLSVGSLDAAVVASLLRELCQYDVPTVLWWAAEGLEEDPHFGSLSAQATTLVVDSSLVRRDARSLKRLARVLAARQRPLPVFDMAYLRVDPWREMIAQFFDTPSGAGDLRTISSVEINSGSTAEALYLAAWLAERLGWTPSAEAGGFRAADGAPITFAHKLSGEQRRVLRVRIATAASTYHATVTDDDASVVSLSVTGARPRSPWLVPLARVDNVSLLERAILTPSIDETFPRALVIAERLGTPATA